MLSCDRAWQRCQRPGLPDPSRRVRPEAGVPQLVGTCACLICSELHECLGVGSPSVCPRTSVLPGQHLIYLHLIYLLGPELREPRWTSRIGGRALPRPNAHPASELQTRDGSGAAVRAYLGVDCWAWLRLWRDRPM